MVLKKEWKEGDKHWGKVGMAVLRKNERGQELRLGSGGVEERVEGREKNRSEVVLWEVEGRRGELR